MNNTREKNFVVYEDYVIEDSFKKEYGTRHYTVLNLSEKFFEDTENPSIVVWYDQERTKIKRERWFTNNEHDRDYEPAYITYYENGQIESEYWYENGTFYKFNNYDEDGRIIDYDDNT